MRFLSQFFFIKTVSLTTFQMWMNVSSPLVLTEGPARTPWGRTSVTVPQAGSEDIVTSVRTGNYKPLVLVVEQYFR